MWFYVNRNYTEINVAAQEKDPHSLLNFYREAICLRKALPVVRNGAYREFYPLSSKFYIYSRETAEQKLLVVCSFSDKQEKLRIPAGFELKNAKLVLKTHEVTGGMLQPYESRVYLWEK